MKRLTNAGSRRAFLHIAARATLLSLAPVTGCRRTGPARTRQTQSAPLSEFSTWLESTAPARMRERHVPGMAVVLIRDGAVVWQRAFGLADASTGRRVDDTTIFEAQSMSKPVFAYVVMKLAEEGVLDLDTPLTTCVSERIIPLDPRLDRITARHVLSHTSGLQNWRSPSAPLAIHFTPGERWQYSGEGYAYLQAAVTRLVGHAHPEPCAQYEGDVTVCATDIDGVMRKRLLEPFGMHSSGYVWDAAWSSRIASPHDERGQSLAKRHPSATDAARYASSGGLHCTASDYARFLIEVVSPGPADPFRLSPAGLQAMLTPTATVPDDPERTSWALGWQVFPTANGDVVAHGGDGLGFHSFAGASTRAKSGFVVMTNGENGWQLLRDLGVRDQVGRWLGWS